MRWLLLATGVLVLRAGVAWSPLGFGEYLGIRRYISANYEKMQRDSGASGDAVQAPPELFGALEIRMKGARDIEAAALLVIGAVLLVAALRWPKGATPAAGTAEIRQ